jgi:hypothetical protein
MGPNNSGLNGGLNGNISLNVTRDKDGRIVLDPKIIENLGYKKNPYSTGEEGEY